MEKAYENRSTGIYLSISRARVHVFNGLSLSLSILSMLRSQDVVQLVNCPCISLILNFTRSSCYLIIWKNEYSWSKRKKEEIYNKNNNLYRLLKDSCLLIGVCYTRQRLVYIMGMNQCFISSLALMQIGSMPRMFT